MHLLLWGLLLWGGGGGVVVDAAGKVRRIVLGFDMKRKPVVSLRNERGVDMLRLGYSTAGKPHLSVTDANGMLRLFAGLSDDDRTSVTLTGELASLSMAAWKDAMSMVMQGSSQQESMQVRRCWHPPPPSMHGITWNIMGCCLVSDLAWVQT